MIKITTNSGIVKGETTAAGHRFLGIPYAAAERFCPPVPAKWQGVWDCTKYAAVAAQPSFRGRWPADTPLQVLGSENCQTLNIWAPHTGTGGKLPVLVYVHGGAFQRGSGNDADCAGDTYTEGAPMVYVSINARLGALGFLEMGRLLGEKYAGSGNNGARDVMCALRWIHENIAAFGGDPERITLSGTSAGAKTISTIMTNPEYGRMFNQAILESGAMQSLRSVQTAQAIADRFIRVLGVQTPEEILRVSTRRIIEAQAKFCDSDGSTCFFGPVRDGELFRDGWRARWESGGAWKGRAIIGACLNELAAVPAQSYFAAEKDAILVDLFGVNKPYADAAYEQLKKDDPALSETALWTRVISDFMYRHYADDMAALLTGCGSQVWLYSFEVTPARHGMGQDMTLHRFQPVPQGCSQYDVDGVTRQMKARILNFVLHGDPERADMIPWPTYGEGKRMVYNIVSHVEDLAYHKPLENFPEYVFEL